VPALSVTVSPGIAVFPPSARSREIRVTVVNNGKGAATSRVRAELPQGWTATPVEQSVSFTREDEAQTVRFEVAAASTSTAGRFRATAELNGTAYARGFEVIEYPHIRRQHIYAASEVRLKPLDVRIAENLTVGYIMGVGDQVPQAIEQLGITPVFLGPDDLAWGDLSRFSTIVTGVRAYERRADLRANNSRLVEYVRNGGTLIVQYNKFEFNEAQYGPYPARVTSERVTDEFAPVTMLAPADPVFTAPNRITEATWQNWVQERGLYFLSEHDEHYRDLISIDEPFPYNRGAKSGGLVVTELGRGRWVYVGLGLWRQLPAGVDGAYQLFANLLSLGHT
jgi:hypothetical protein